MDTTVRALALLGLCVPIGVLVHGLRAPNMPTRPDSEPARKSIASPSLPAKRVRHKKARKSKNRRNRHRSKADDATQRMDDDSGERWRVKLASGRFLYQSEGGLVASQHFFSLFRIKRSGASTSAQLLGVHGGGWLGSVTHGSARLAVQPSPDGAQPIWAERRSADRVVLGVQEDRARYLCEDAQRPGTFLIGDRNAPSGRACSSDEFELQRVIGAQSGELNQTHDATALERTVRRSTMRVDGRGCVLATYHNVGMMHWAALFWGWLQASSITKLLLLDLDGLTCAASSALRPYHAPRLQIECATAADMTLGKQYILGKTASGLQDWGTRSNSGYFKFLRMKLRLVELVIAHGVDIVIADVDVIVLSPHFLHDMASRGKDLVISSDARAGSYNDNYYCPCSHPMYQRHTADWVCAGLFYMRSSTASSWFMRQVQQYMDDFTITDQDAIQGLLTGHTQVAVPQVPSRRAAPSRAEAGAVSPLAPGFRPSGLWLKPLWLEELSTAGNLRDVAGIVPLNTPMRPSLWRKCMAKQRSAGFTWEVLPLDRYGNGPTLVHNWGSLFGAATARGGGAGRSTAASFRSIHANCNAKVLLERDLNGTSYLTRPPPAVV